ncbi:GNAT family N-acetyltransferase [Pedobacter jejuensis]|uniref:N-acetyltransferase n=1 Tax=Pedobacter jejuensis TaxID=1268550 RepID=A0A3N0BNQ0_9SPHI|nr:GNAT family N-acetyltransferase [Pedobacter jejuensis]RNL50289.1 N-acetyltransferase [Pedobacter jejuensis]
MLLHITSLTPTQKTQISTIWNNEYPKPLNFSDAQGFDDYLATLSQPIHYLLENENGEILAWACKFIRDNEKWFAIILDEKIHEQGKGTALLNALKESETVLNAWVIDKEDAIKQNGEIYKSPLKFYLKNGFLVYPEIRLKNEKMSAVKIIWKK